MGNGTTTNRSTPVKILDNVSSVSLGGWHSAAIKTDGSLWMWGYNHDGQLGDGTITNRSAPVKILDNVFSVSLGLSHSVAFRADGSLWMWGGNSSNTPVKIADKARLVSAGCGTKFTGGLFVLDDESLWQYTLDAIPPSKTQIYYVPGIYLDNESLTLPVNATAIIQAYIHPASNRDSALVWVSSDPDVAAVEKGVVTAKGAGEADITMMATKTGDTAVCHVSVPAPLTLDKDAVTLRVGETYQLTPTLNRAPGEETGVAWFSTAPDVASVSDDGAVTAVAGGTATVSVVTLDGAYKADYVVTVPYEVTGITLDRASLTMKPGDSVTLTASVIPADAVEKGVRWISSAPSVATVADGLVKAWSVGKTTVTAATVSGGFTATCTVNVTESGAEPRTYTITLHPNGGTFDPNSATASPITKTLTDEDTVYGALPEPLRDGYAFQGWHTATEYGTPVTPQTKFEDKRSQTLYAVWAETRKTYAVTFEANGGTVSPSSKTVTAGGVYGTLPAPTRAGCSFLGWFTEPDGGTRITPETQVRLTAKQTLYARWAATNLPMVSADGREVSGVGRLSDYADRSLDGSLVVADAESPDAFSTATAFCAVYDESGRMACVQTWGVDVSDPRNILFTGEVRIPKGVTVSAVRIIVVSGDFAPLRVSGML